METHDSLSLKQIADNFLLKGRFCRDVSLFHGKTGMSLFFFLYSRYTCNSGYESFAEELLDEVCSNLSALLSVTFADGLCGIGWSIEFLKQQGFIEGDTDDILAEIDRKIMERDVRRLTDTSLENGLIGIVAYVYSRLHSNRTQVYVPFDVSYLAELETTCTRMGIEFDGRNFQTDAIWKQVLDCFSLRPYSVDTSWLQGLIRIQKNVPEPLSESSQDLYELEWADSSLKNLFIFANASIGRQYGVGTYLTQLVQCFSPEEWNINVITLQAFTNEVKWERENQVSWYEIPLPHFMWNNCSSLDYNRYYKSVFYYLSVRISKSSSIFCHFNMFGHDVLAGLCKEKWQAKIFFTLHYTNWGIDLLGDKAWMQRILENPMDKKEEAALRHFQREKDFMHQYCDRVIAIARHSYHTLKEMYKLPEEKLALIPHGVSDGFVERTADERKQLKLKYGFNEKEKIVIFAGRLDKGKGILELITAFKLLSKEMPEVRLVIAGSGAYTDCMKTAMPNWKHILFTGFLPKEQLYELYTIADVGVVPSYYEELGFVALEMMMNKLPVIVHNTTGLKEISDNGKYTTIFCFDKNKDSASLKDAILKAVTEIQSEERLTIARNKVLNNYSMTLFQERMKTIYTGMETPYWFINNLNINNYETN